MPWTRLMDAWMRTPRSIPLIPGRVRSPAAGRNLAENWCHFTGGCGASWCFSQRCDPFKGELSATVIARVLREMAPLFTALYIFTFPPRSQPSAHLAPVLLPLTPHTPDASSPKHKGSSGMWAGCPRERPISHPVCVCWQPLFVFQVYISPFLCPYEILYYRKKVLLHVLFCLYATKLFLCFSLSFFFQLFQLNISKKWN